MNWKEETSPKRRLRVGDPNFKPPDGGWGWLIVFSCGLSNLCTFPMFQQFGLIFRDKFAALGISNAETTTVINLNSAFNACTGLFNGPVYSRFSYRQVAFFGSSLVVVSLFFTSFCKSFWAYIIVYSMFYGSGIGTNQSSNSLALNTYFKEKRRIATGLSWTTTALGPIIWPYVITVLMSYYGMEGTVMLFAAFAGHAVVCSLLLHPVQWHTKIKDVENIQEPLIAEERPLKKESNSIFSSLYVLNEDDPENTGYEILDPAIPRMVGANDGYFSHRGSKISLNSNISTQKSNLQSGQNSFANSKRPSYINLADAKRKRVPKPLIKELIDEELYPKEIEVLETAAIKLEKYKEITVLEEKSRREKMSSFEKFCEFFDFNLLKDVKYLNLMMGITIANFAELNFSILTPFVLKEFNFEDFQVATFMSLLAASDILVRFVVPFLAGKIGWDNRSFFLFGVLSMAFGRIILVHTQTYSMSLVVAVIIGCGKGLRTIFMALVIPSYVPLDRLPAASGLQLAFSGMMFLCLGPVVGWIRDLVNNYVITLHLLNIMTYITTIAWTIERILSKRKRNTVAS